MSHGYDKNGDYTHAAISAQRYGDWTQQSPRHKKRRHQAYKVGTRSARGAKTSHFHGIIWCPWRGAHGMWSAVLPASRPGDRGGRQDEVVGYFKREGEAIEARRRAISERAHAYAVARGGSVGDALDKHAAAAAALGGGSSSAIARRQRRRRDARIKKNRMHTARALMGNDLPGAYRDAPHGEDHRKARQFRKYVRNHAWHPQQLAGARDRLAETMDLQRGAKIPRHDDHGVDWGGMDNRGVALAQSSSFSPRGGLPPIEATSLPLPPVSPRAKNNKFQRHNLLDMEQKARFDRLDRDRRVRNGPLSYNAFGQRQHSWMTYQAKLADARRRASMLALEETRRREQAVAKGEDPNSPSAGLNDHHHHHKHHAHVDIFGHTHPELDHEVGTSIAQLRNHTLETHDPERRIRRHAGNRQQTPPSNWPSNKFLAKANR